MSVILPAEAQTCKGFLGYFVTGMENAFDRQPPGHFDEVDEEVKVC